MSGSLSQLDSGDSDERLYLGYSRREAASTVKYSDMRDVVNEVVEEVA